MVENNRKALKSGVWYTVSNFLVKGIIFITTPIFTRLLTKEEFGIYNNYLSWLALMNILVTLNLDSTLISARFDYSEEFDKYILSVLSFSSITGLLWLGIVNIGRSFFVELFDLPMVYINVMLLYLLFFPAVTMFQAREQYRFEYKRSVAVSFIISVGSTLVSVLLVMFMTDKLAGRIYGAAIPTILFGICLYIYFIKKGGRIELRYWKYAIPICLPYIPHLLSMTLLNSTDRVMISKWCSTEDTAMYSLAYTVGTMVTMLITALHSAFAPWLGEKLNDEKYDEVKKFSKVYMLAFLFFSIGIMLIAPEALYILGGAKYMDAKYVMPPVAMGCICQFLYTMVATIEQFKKKTGGMAVASMMAALINLGLNYIFIPIFGYMAAAYTTLAGYLCLLLMHMFLVYRLKLSKIYNYRFIYMVVFAGMALMMLITLLYQLIIIRYITCVLYAGLAIYVFLRIRDKVHLLRGVPDKYEE